MAATNWYVNSVAYAAVTQWSAGLTATVGMFRRQLAAPAVGNERVWRCTTGGTTGGSEPAWTLTKGSTTSDNGVVWTEVTGQEAYQSAGAWSAPYARVETAFLASRAVGGDFIFVSSNHAQTSSSDVTISSTGTVASLCYIICVDESGSGHVPPTSADLKTTATVTATGTANMTIDSGGLYAYGITFSHGTSSNTTVMRIASASGAHHIFEACALKKQGTGATANAFILGVSATAGADSSLTWINTTIQFDNTSDSISLRGTRFKWINTASAITGATLPNTLFTDGGNAIGGTVNIEAVDLSALGSGKTLVGAYQAPINFFFKYCKLGASVTISGTQSRPGYAEIYLTCCDNGATNNRNEKYNSLATETTETTVIRTGGSSDGTTGFSHKIATSANPTWAEPFLGMPLAIWNGTTGSNVTATIEGIYSAAALPNNDDIGVDFEYFGASGNPQGSFASGTKSNIMASGSALTASTQAWDSLATARANTTTYAVGDIRKVASNPGRLFIVTAQTGASAGSEPGGFASAVDGGTVTDGNVTWRAMVRFKQAITISSPQPQLAGLIYGYPKAFKPSTTFYLDRIVALS